MRIQIVTCNNKYMDGKYTESYHEIHEIDNLNGLNHSISTIKNIIHDNLLYKPENCMLESVIISGDDSNIIDNIIGHFIMNPIGVIIHSAETACMV